MRNPKLTYREISAVCLELSMFLHAGAENGSAFELLSKATDTPGLKNKLKIMSIMSDDGKSLSEVFDESGLFPFEVVKMLKIGEDNGKSEETLIALSKYYDRLDTFDSSARLAVLYPSLLFSVMLSVIVLLLSYVLPIFSDVYVSFGKNLTGVGAVLFDLGNVLRNIMPFLAIVMVVFVSFLVVFSCSQRFRSCIFGFHGASKRGIAKKSTSARFAFAFSLGISGGLTPVQAIEQSSELLSSEMLKNKCKLCAEKISGGASLGDELFLSGLLPASESRLLELGFKSGSGESVSNEIAKRLERDADIDLERKVGRIEPIIVIVSSLLVGIILVSVMLPLTNIMSMVG